MGAAPGGMARSMRRRHRGRAGQGVLREQIAAACRPSGPPRKPPIGGHDARLALQPRARLAAAFIQGADYGVAFGIECGCNPSLRLASGSMCGRSP